MKIVFALGSSNPFPGAGWTRIGFFAKDWSKKGHHVEVLGTFSYNNIRNRGLVRLRNLNIFNIIINIGLMHPIFFIFNTLSAFFFSIVFFVSRKPDIAIISVPSGDFGLGLVMGCKFTRTKCIIDYRDEWEDQTVSIMKSNYEKSFYVLIKKIINFVYSDYLITTVTENFVSSLKKRGLKVKLFPNGADVTVFKNYDKNSVRMKYGFSEKDFIIVYSGLIGAYYNFENIFSVLTKIDKAKNIKFVIIGNGPDVPQLLLATKHLRLIGKFYYLGVKNSKKEVAEVLSTGDVGFIPGLYTKGQLPVKFFEYCACEIPVLALIPSDSLLNILIDKHQIGLTIKPNDESELLGAIKFLFNDEQYRNHVGKRARCFVEKNFDRNKISKEFLNLVRGFFIG